MDTNARRVRSYPRLLSKKGILQMAEASARSVCPASFDGWAEHDEKEAVYWRNRLEVTTRLVQHNPSLAGTRSGRIDIALSHAKSRHAHSLGKSATLHPPLLCMQTRESTMVYELQALPVTDLAQGCNFPVKFGQFSPLRHFPINLASAVLRIWRNVQPAALSK